MSIKNQTKNKTLPRSKFKETLKKSIISHHDNSILYTDQNGTPSIHQLTFQSNALSILSTPKDQLYKLHHISSNKQETELAKWDRAPTPRWR